MNNIINFKDIKDKKEFEKDDRKSLSVANELINHRDGMIEEVKKTIDLNHLKDEFEITEENEIEILEKIASAVTLIQVVTADIYKPIDELILDNIPIIKMALEE